MSYIILYIYWFIKHITNKLTQKNTSRGIHLTRPKILSGARHRGQGGQRIARATGGLCDLRKTRWKMVKEVGKVKLLESQVWKLRSLGLDKWLKPLSCRFELIFFFVSLGVCDSMGSLKSPWGCWPNNECLQMGYVCLYPLVNIQKTMENHYFSWENSL
jgi:hypothetical protein